MGPMESLKSAFSLTLGEMPKDEPVAADGPDAYFATIPVRKMADAIRHAGLPGSVSYSAGTFVCNTVMYSVLHHYKNTDVKAGFIHVPYLPEQAERNNKKSSMSLEAIHRALHLAIEAIISVEDSLL